MKALLKSMIALFAVALIFGLSSCTDDKSAPVSSESTSSDIYSTYAFTPSADLALSTITEGSLNCEVGLVNNDFNLTCRETCTSKLGENMQLRRVFREMKLTKEQMAQIPAFMAEFNECQMQSKIALRQSEMAIIKKSNADLRAVLADLKAGNITRAEASQKIKAINQETRESLKNNPDRATALAAMKACRDNLFASIRGILTAEQQVIWDAWVAKIS